MSFGQAALLFFLPRAVSCLTYLMILFEDDLPGLLPTWRVSLSYLHSKKIYLSRFTGRECFRALFSDKSVVLSKKPNFRLLLWCPGRQCYRCFSLLLCHLSRHFDHVLLVFISRWCRFLKGAISNALVAYDWCSTNATHGVFARQTGPAIKNLLMTKSICNLLIAHFLIFLFDSALATVLSDAKANVGNTPNVAAPQSVAMDDSVFMLALAIFILSAPKEVVLASDLQSQSINVFNRCITSTNIQVSRLFYRSFWVV